RRADDPDREVQGLGRAEPRRQEALDAVGRRGADLEGLVEEAEEDDSEQRRDRELEGAKSAAAQLDEAEGDEAGHHAGDEERDVEEQVEPERRAEELGDVGGHRDDLGLYPHSPGRPARVVRPEALGKVAVGDDPELGRQVLDQHGHQVRREHHPEQEVAEAGAARDVGGEVARIYVGDRGDERGAEHHQRRAQPAAAEEGLERGDPRFARLDREGLGGGHAASTRIALASTEPSTWILRPTRTNSGPSKGCRSTSSSLVPGTIPRLPRKRSMSGSESEMRTNVATSPGSSSTSACDDVSASSSSRLGIGSPCGSTVGLPSLAAISASSSSES